MNDPRRILRDGVIRELRRLGAGRKELENLLGIPRVTVNRALAGASRPSAPRARQLSAQKQWWVTTFWYYKIAGHDGFNPPPLDQLLRRFCDVCCGRGRAADERPPKRQPRDPTSLGGIFTWSKELCENDPQPEQCVTGPARFGLLCDGLAAHPFVVAVFLTQHVNTRGVWVRECVKCEGQFVSPSPAHRHCGCAPDDQKRPHQLSLTRVAATELSLRA